MEAVEKRSTARERLSFRVRQSRKRFARRTKTGRIIWIVRTAVIVLFVILFALGVIDADTLTKLLSAL